MRLPDILKQTVAFGVVAVATVMGGCSDDDDSSTAFRPTDSPTITATRAPSPTATRTPAASEEALPPEEAFPGVPLLPNARLIDSSVIRDTQIPVPFETEENVQFYTVLDKRNYEVPLSEAEVTAFYQQPPTEWRLAYEDKPIIWTTDGGKRSVWILVFPGGGSKTLVAFQEGRVTE